MRLLKQTEARKLVHEVACWIAYERETRGFLLYSPWEYGVMHGGYQVVKQNLGGACAIASYILAFVLRMRGYSAGVIQFYYKSHWVVETACGWLLDPTREQFASGKGPMARRLRKTDGARMGVTFELLMDPCPFGYRKSATWPPAHIAAIDRILRRMGVDRP